MQTEDGSISVRHANFLERIFITLEHPDQSIFGTWISIFIMIVIVVSCTCYVVSTMPELKYQPKYDADGKFCREESPLTKGKEIQSFHCLDEDTCSCEPKPLPFLDGIEMFSIFIFTLDYVIRLCTVFAVPLETAGLVPIAEADGMPVQPQKMSKVGKTIRYASTFLNIIDAIAIVPFWIDIFQENPGGGGFGFVRVLRLARVFRIFRLGKFSEGLGLFVRTMESSMPALTLLGFFNIIGSVLFGSMAYFCEMGKWRVTEEFPNGGYLRQNLYANPSDDQLEWELSPFLSIPYAFYWTFVTGTTVGYGDMYPQSGLGKVIAVLCMTAGILVLALPITVIGSNFTREYGAMHGDLEEDVMPVKGQLPPKAVKGGSGMAGNAMSSSDIKSLVREAISALSDEMHFKGAGALPVLRATGPGNVGLSGTKSKISQHASPDHFNNLSSELQKMKGIMTGVNDCIISLERQLQQLHIEDGSKAADDFKPLNEEKSSGRHSPMDNNVYDRARHVQQGSVHNIYHPERYADESPTGSGGFSLQLDLAKHGLTQKVVPMSPERDDGRVVRIDSFGSSQADSFRSSERHTEPVSETSSDRETDRRASDTSSSGPPTSRRSSLADLGQTMAGLFTKEETAIIRSVENNHGENVRFHIQSF